MSSAQRLRVIGSRSVFQFFLPPKVSQFETHEFLHIRPGESSLPSSDKDPDGSLSIIVNPEEYGSHAVNQVKGEVWLWFLRPLAISHEFRLEEAPRLWGLESRSLEQRKRFLSNVQPNNSPVVVVSDEASYNYCHQRGSHVVLSPPPVSDAVTSVSSEAETRVAVWVDNNPSVYMKTVMRAIPPDVVILDRDSHLDMSSNRPSHWIVPHESLARTLPYEAAVCLRAGSTLITGHLWPRWGLEPGVDYLEYSTPEELGRIVDHLFRYPKSTHLLAQRGAQKSGVFDAGKVYRRFPAGAVT